MRRILVLLVAVVMLAGAAAWWVHVRITTPYRGFTGAETFVDLPPGTSVTSIAAKLTVSGVVPDPMTFRIAAKLSNAERQLKAGEYRFSDPVSPAEVVSRLARGDVFTKHVTFPEGLTIKEMGVVFEKNGLGPALEFERAARNAALVAEFDPDAVTLEGYLFPDTYALPRNAGADALVQAMVSRFGKALDSDLRAAAADRRWSIHDVVTLASLVEKETAAPDERVVVAGVYANRLGRRVPLQCDPTVIYALMRAGRWRGNLTRADLDINSPYNTYRHAGLPPGPIASPGLAALRAAAQPADVPFFYFVSRNDGTHEFATTLAEHSRNVAKWQVQYFRERRNR